MNRLRLLAVLFVFTTSLHADLVIVQDVDAVGQKLTMTMKTKGSLMRVDVNPQMSMIIDGATGDMKTLMHEQKMFMTMNVESMKGMIAAATKTTDPNVKPIIKPLGNHEKINGFDTEEYLMTQGDVTSHLWIAKNHPHYEAFVKAMETMRKGPIGQMNPQMQMDMSQLPGMPLKSIVEMNGKTTATSMIRSVDETELPLTDFEAPADYKVFSMPAMGPAKPDSP